MQLQPTFVSVDQELLRRLHTVCESALENASECLTAHDNSLGRIITRKNKMLAELYEQDVRDAQKALAEVRLALGWPEKNKPEAKTDKPAASEMPDRFITLTKETTRIRRYSRTTDNGWDVHEWDGNWQFYDNVWESSALEAFINASFVASEAFRK